MSAKGRDKFFWSWLGKAVFLGVVVTLTVLFVPKIQKTKAANCGGATVCVCGDTVTSSYTLPADLTCSGHGLVVGAAGITINGGGHTMTGDGGQVDYGINDSGGWDNITIQNFANITSFGNGIYLDGVTGSTIQNNTVSSNRYGIFLSSSPTNTLAGNLMSTNTTNLSVYSSSTANYNNTIGTTNKVEGKSVYYFYDTDGTAEVPLVYDGNVLGNDIGTFWCISCDYVQVKNATLSAYNDSGVYFRNTTHSTVENITSNSNGCGINLIFSSSNTLSGNTTNSNAYGINLGSSSSNTLSGNTANSNIYGIYLSSSPTNTLTGNLMSTNSYNFFVYSSNIVNYNNTIGTTNKVEGKSVYYFYDHDGTAEVPLVYDGNVLGNDIGTFWCISCDYVQVKNATLSARNYAGVYFKNTTHSTIGNVIANSNYSSGIYLTSSSSNTLSGNTTNLNSYYGIYLESSSSSNTLSGNTANSNIYGIYLSSSPTNTLTGNHISNNNHDYFDDGANTYSTNQFNHNLVSKMLAFTDAEARTKSIGEIINFSITAKKADGTACASCTTCRHQSVRSIFGL